MRNLFNDLVVLINEKVSNSCFRILSYVERRMIKKLVRKCVNSS